MYRVWMSHYNMTTVDVSNYCTCIGCSRSSDVECGHSRISWYSEGITRRRLANQQPSCAGYTVKGYRNIRIVLKLWNYKSMLGASHGKSLTITVNENHVRVCRRCCQQRNRIIEHKYIFGGYCHSTPYNNMTTVISIDLLIHLHSLLQHYC